MIVALIGHTDVFDPKYHEAFAALGYRQAEGTFWLILLRGIIAGWLIALMVWLLPGSQGSHFWVILVTTYLVALGNLTHVIAGSLEVLYLVTTDRMSWVYFVGEYFLPTLIGNVIGGVALVAVLNHAQVVTSKRKG